jgi:endo-1,3(4)-beta-glucanase
MPVALGAPPSEIPQQGGHPVPRLGITDAGTGPIETNKFYANIFLGTQGQSVFTEPYSMMWSQGSGNAMSYGMSVSHISASQRVFGPANTALPNSPNSYYINPIGIQSIIFSAAEFGSQTTMTSDSLLAFSANIQLSPTPGSSSSLSMPVVQGMAFVSGLYDSLQAVLESSVFFQSVTSAESPKPGMYKYRAILEDGTTWLIYAVPNAGIPQPNFQLTSSTMLQGIPSWSGLIQVAKNPISDDTLYDNAAGTYPTSGSISGYQLDNTASASYSMSWTKGGAFGCNTTLLMYALPHHVQSFDNTTSSNVNSSLQLDTTTKGVATAVVADSWTLVEELPVDMGFYPYSPGNGSASTLSSTAITAIQNVSATEASQNMSAQSDLNSMYYSGKALSKFAQITLVMHDLADQEELANAALVELESAYALFTNNSQQFPLLYDTDWKGVVSSASYVTNDSGVDFGNSYYNDHHFHYGYFISAAAVIGYLDPTWIPANKDWVNALVRDVSNPSSQDQYFPVFRSFDWYSGHSWAKGLFESGDGKDEESSSEDTMFSYGLKMWGRVIGDASMEARGNLMLAVQARTLQNYFLLESSNVNQPAQFIGNKVTGILFQNKVDHTTYFGSNYEYIQGIHMIPIMPFSTLTRTQQFVAEEWITYFVDGAVDPASNVTGGWKGILYSNLAIIDPATAYDFFTQPNFDPTWLDGGASLTWYIALSAGLGGAPS